MKERRLIPALLEMINPVIDTSTRFSSSAQFRYLSPFVLRTLGRLVPKMTEEFTSHGGPPRCSSFFILEFVTSFFLIVNLKKKTSLNFILNSLWFEFFKFGAFVFLMTGWCRLFKLVEWSMTLDFDTEMVLEFTKTICTIVAIKCTNVLANFRDEGMVNLLFSE